MRYLVTTALEDCWPDDRPVLLLGEWCRRYERRARWSQLDVKMAPPIDRSPTERDRARDRVRRIAEAMLPKLGAALDDYHGEHHSTRYWRIVLGHWLLRYVSVLYNRYTSLSDALATCQLTGTAVLASGSYDLATADSDSFVWASNDDLWNHVLYARILRFLTARGRAISIDQVAWGRSFEHGFAVMPRPAIPREGLRRRVASLATLVLPRFARDGDAFLLASYLPVTRRLLLELSLGQVPQVWRSTPAPPAPSDPSRRRSLPILPTGIDELEVLAGENWRDMIPTCFVEGHAALVAGARSQAWPTRPRFVFTSNAFDTDEQFKVWVAQKADDGVPYIVGQHGNNYGTHRWWGADFWPERVAANRFITWGWSGAGERDLPAFLLKAPAGKSRRYTPAGGLLLIEVAIPHRVVPHDSDAEFAVYQEGQFRFVEALPNSIRSHLTVRLYAEYRKHSWGEEQRWADRAPDVVLEKGFRRIGDLVRESRIVVHSYDSTGILETLALDVPTMCFWDSALDDVLPSAAPYYELLRNAGILHFTPEAAASAVARRWDGVAAWWQSSVVRRARQAFCDRYARTDLTPVRTLRRLLTSVEGAKL